MKFCHALDLIVVTLASIVPGVGALLLSQAQTSESHIIETQLLLLPLIGALLVSGGFILLNPKPETRRIVIGRSIFAVFLGVVLPQVVGMFHPALAAAAIRPAVLLLAGGVISGLAYVMSKPFVQGLYERAEGEAKAQLDKLQEQLHPVQKETKTIIETKEIPMAATVSDLPKTQTITTTEIKEIKP